MIEVGEYVRTDKGNIGKVLGIYPGHHLANYHIEFQTNTKRKRQYLSMKTIKSHSKFLIDLIECGDYVNGHLVTKAKESITYASIEVENSIAKKEIIPEDNIRDIVTHEQFEQIKYKVNGDNKNE